MENQTFTYSYSASQTREAEAIRKKYAPREKDKLDELRALDAEVKRPANVLAYTLGGVSSLVMGVGMSLVMSELGAGLGLSAGASLAVGIAVGLVGGLAVLAYPVYHATVKARRKRIAPEILRLTDQLLK